MIRRQTDFRCNLAGPPVRQSEAVDPSSKDRRQHTGIIKLRLAHSKGASYLVPDVLIGVAGSRYFLPSFFSAPWMALNFEEGKHKADFSIDVGPPKAAQAARLLVTVHSEDHIRAYEDGAQLYRCTYNGPRAIVRFATGLCQALPDEDFALEVFHHTTSDAAAKILASGELWSSLWNLAGTRELTNVAYTYFSSLPRIQTEEDLRRIAMSSVGAIQFQTTSDRVREDVLTLRVYRGSTAGLTESLAFNVPCGIISPAHLYFHSNVGANGAYYEVIGPEIVRVGVNPKATLRVSGGNISVVPTDLKRFEYVVLGDTWSVAGLEAPYEEENTGQVTHLERLDQGLDLFQFWMTNQNTDQVSGRVFEERLLKPVENN